MSEEQKPKPKSNVVSIGGQELDPEQLIAVQKKRDAVVEMLINVKKENAFNVMVIGVGEEGMFIMDSEQNILNANYLLSAALHKLHEPREVN